MMDWGKMTSYFLFISKIKPHPTLSFHHSCNAGFLFLQQLTPLSNPTYYYCSHKPPNWDDMDFFAARPSPSSTGFPSTPKKTNISPDPK
jgi:hypothetical protein